MDSFVIADIIEALGDEHGVPSNLPECTGAVFVMDQGWDLGAPVPVSDITAQTSLDGERPYGRRASNRTLILPISIFAPDRRTLAAARETLLKAIDEEEWLFKWTRDDSPDLDGSGLGQAAVFTCFRGLASKPEYSVTDEQQQVCSIELQIPALPYARSEVAEILAFETNVTAASFTTATPPDPLLLDVYDTIAAGNPGWVASPGKFGGGPAALFERLHGAVPTYIRVFESAKDLSPYTAINAHVGLSTPASNVYVREAGTNFSVAITLFDSSGMHMTLGGSYGSVGPTPMRKGKTSRKTRRGEHGSPVYKKHPVTIGLVPPLFDITAVTGYTLAFTDNPRGTVEHSDVYIGELWAMPPTSASRNASVPVPAGSRGVVYDLNGILGSAQAPVSLTCQQYTSSGMFSTSSEFSSSDVWKAPAGTTSAVVESVGRGGRGAGTIGGGTIGGGGGGGGQYRQDPSMPVTPGTVYDIEVDVAGNVSFTGDGGRTCTAAAGSASSNSTGGAGGTGGTDHSSQFHHDGGAGASVSGGTSVPADALWLLSQPSGSSVTDSTGNGNTGTASNVTWSGTNAGGSFDGADSEIDTSAGVLDTAASFSVSAWANLSATTGYPTVVSQDGVHCSSFSLQLNSGTGNWRFQRLLTDASGSPAEADAESSVSASTSTWYHLVGTFDSATGDMKIYIDGTVSGAGANDASPFASTGASVIGRGRYNDASSGFLNGSVSDVALYQRLLSPSDVAHVFAEGRSGDGSTLSDPVLTGGGGGGSGGSSSSGSPGSGITGGVAVAGGGAGGNGGDLGSAPASEPGHGGLSPGGGGGGAAQDASDDVASGEGGSPMVRLSYEQSTPTPFPNFIAHIPYYDATTLAPFYIPLANSGPAASGTSIASGGTLTAGSHISSPNNLFKLIMQDDGDLVVRNPGLRGSIGDGPLDWHTGTAGAGSGSGYHLDMLSNGDLVVYDGSAGIVWDSGTSGHSGAHLELMPDGMLVIFDVSGEPIWSNRRFPGVAVTAPMQEVSSDGSTGFNARWSGTYSMMLAGLLWAHPTVQRTITVTVTQYGYQGGLPYVQTLECVATPSEWPNGVVTLGEMTIPLRELPPENEGAYYTVSVNTGDPDDLTLDLLFIDTMGQSVIINVSGAGYGQYFMDEPTPERDIGVISGTLLDRKESVGVMSSTFVSGGPLTIQPGNQQIFLYSVDGSPALQASYYPRWFVDRWDA